MLVILLRILLGVCLLLTATEFYLLLKGQIVLALVLTAVSYWVLKGGDSE